MYLAKMIPKYFFSMITCARLSLISQGIKRGDVSQATPISLLSEETQSCRHPFLFLSLPYNYPFVFWKIRFSAPSFFPNHMHLINCGRPKLLESSKTWPLLVLIISNKILFRILCCQTVLLIFKCFIFIL